MTEQVGLDWKWAEACFDAGHRLQGIWHKIGIETARIDPYLDGFVCWLMIDISPSSQNGVLDMFWEPKKSTPEYFRQFNSPTVILARTADPASPEALGLNPATLIYTAGDVLDVDWVVSHFQPSRWRTERSPGGWLPGTGKLGGGKIDRRRTSRPASVRVVGRSRIAIPPLDKAVKARLIVELEAARAANSWNLWIFPKFQPQPDGGKALAARPGCSTCSPRDTRDWPSSARPAAADRDGGRRQRPAGAGRARGLGTGQERRLPVAARLQPASPRRAAWDGGRSAIRRARPLPPIRPSATFPTTATSIRAGSAWSTRPRSSIPAITFRTVEPLMVGIGRETGYAFGTLGYPLGFNLYAFQARVGQGKLLATGLNLASENPGGGLPARPVHPLRRLAAVPAARDVRSRRAPRENERARGTGRQPQRLERDARSQREDRLAHVPSHRADVRGPAIDASRAAWPGRPGRGRPTRTGMVTFRWIANLGWQSQPAGGQFHVLPGWREAVRFRHHAQVADLEERRRERRRCGTRSRASTAMKTAPGSWS